MKTKEQKIILESDPNVATYRTDIKGWVDINGLFRGEDKAMAIYNSITHKKCECGNLMEKQWTACKECRHKADIERYNKLPFKEWDGKAFVYSRVADKYFWDESDIEDYCVDNDIKSEDMRFVLCDPCYIEPIDGSQWEDLLPEDVDHFPRVVEDAIAVFNKAVKSFPPISWARAKQELL